MCISPKVTSRKQPKCFYEENRRDWMICWFLLYTCITYWFLSVAVYWLSARRRKSEVSVFVRKADKIGWLSDFLTWFCVFNYVGLLVLVSRGLVALIVSVCWEILHVPEGVKGQEIFSDVCDVCLKRHMSALILLLSETEINRKRKSCVVCMCAIYAYSDTSPHFS